MPFRRLEAQTTKFTLISSIVSAIVSVAQAHTNAVTVRASTYAQIEHTIQSHVTNRDTSFTVVVPVSEYSHIDAALTAALQSNPYLAHDYVQEGYSGTESGTSADVHFQIQYTESKSQYQFVQKRVTQILSQIIKPSMSDLQKELAIHNYIVLHTAYDETLANTTPYDAFTQGTTVCNGYAMLTYLMMTHAGIPSRIVDGNAGGQSHAWNMVQVGGHWYNLDTTWDDPVPDQPGHIHYDYFNLTDAQITRDHTRSSKGFPPATTDFVALLNTESKSSAAAKSVLMSTGLYLESPQYTFNSMTALKVALTSHSTTFTFRFPDGLMTLLATVPLTTRGGSYEYVPDHRDPRYDVVTWRFN